MAGIGCGVVEVGVLVYSGGGPGKEAAYDH